MFSPTITNRSAECLSAREAQEILHQLGVPRVVPKTNIFGDWRQGWSTPVNFRICCPGGWDTRRKEFEKSAAGPIELLEITVGMVNAGGKDYGKNWAENLVKRTTDGEKIPIILHMTSQPDRPSGVVGVVELDTARPVLFGGANNPCPEWSEQCNGNFEGHITIPVKPIADCPIRPFKPVLKKDAGGWYPTRGKPSQLKKMTFEGVEEIIQALKKL